MLIIKDGDCLNLANALSFFKTEKEIKKDGIFKKDPNPPAVQYSIEFYFPHSMMRMGKINYDSEETRNFDFNKILESYNLNLRVLDLDL